MALIKKHWLAFSLQVVFLLSGGFWLAWEFAQPNTAIGQDIDQIATQSPEYFDPIALARINQIRKALSLTNSDLAAMGLSKNEAISIFSLIVRWEEVNGNNFNQTRIDEATARKRLREIVLSMRAKSDYGDAGSQLDSARGNVTETRKSKQSIIDQIATMVDQMLNFEQRGMRKAAQNNLKLDVPSELRYAKDLSREDIQELKRKQRIRSREQPILLADVLRYEHKRDLDNAINQRDLSLDDVLAAEQEVFPTPDIPEDEFDFGINEPVE